MGNPPTLLHDRTFKNRNMKIYKVDEQFIVASKLHYLNFSKVVYFFSTETLELFTSLGVVGCECAYDRGLFFQDRSNAIVRILDVATGTFFNDVYMPFRKYSECSLM